MKKIIIILIILIMINITAYCNIDSLKTKLEKSNKIEKAEILIDIANEYYNAGNSKEAIDYVERVVNLNNLGKGILIKIDAFKILGDLYSESFQYEKALDYLFQSIELAESIDDVEVSGWTYNQIGIIYEDIQINEKALANYIKAEEAFKKEKDERSLGGIYNNLGNMYFEMNDRVKALHSYNVAIQINKKYGNDKWVAASIYNIGLIYLEEEKYMLALDNIQESYLIYASLKDTASYFNSFIQISECYLELGKIDSSLVYIEKAENFINVSGLEYPEIDLLYYKSNIFFEQGRLQESLELYFQVKKIATKFDDINWLLDINHKISDVYAELGDYERAYQYQIEYIAAKDFLKEDEKMALLIHKQKEYELGIFQEQIHQERETEKLKNKATIFKARLIGWLLFVIVIGLLTAVYLIYKYGKLQKKNNSLLTNSNNINNKLISILSHDMKNTLYSIKSGTRILSDEIDKLDKESIKMFIRELSKSTENIYGFMENILLWTKSQADKIEVDKQSINLSLIVDNTIDLFEHTSRAKKIEVLNKISDSVLINTDKNMMEFIIRNLIQNAVKYTKNNGKIEISSEIKQDNMKISIIDDGIGIPEDKIDSIFNPTNRYSRKGTANEKGTGLGLVICKEFVQKMGGTIHCQSEPGKGSNFYILLPLK